MGLKKQSILSCPLKVLRTFILLVFVPAAFVQGQSLLDRDWQCNSVLENAQSYTIPDIGACQGVSLINNKLYFYGDRSDLTPRRGEIHEYTLGMKPTGRRLILNRRDKPVMTHPTGIAYLDKNHVLIGNTVNQRAVIFLVDWELAWKEGGLDNAIRNEVVDDLAINGCRPLAIAAFGTRWIATADYGDQKNEVRLYDPARMMSAKRTSEKGVLLKKFRMGPFNQNLAWSAERGQLIGIQNVVPGLGWRLQFVDLAQAVENQDVLDKGGAMKQEWVFPAHTELEGFTELPDGRWVMVTAHRQNNVWIGRHKKIESLESKRGYELPYYK